VVLCVPGPVWAWGCEGHEAIALIAESHLNPRALAAVDKLLAENPIDPALSRFCKLEGLDAMANSSTWADDYRRTPDGKSSAPWHFIDIPRGAPRGDISRYCPLSSGCITSALSAQIRILRDPAAASADRAKALRWVLHFAGEMQQPLHCTNDNDEGAHCFPVEFFGEQPTSKDPARGEYSPNLHGLWDYGIIQREIGHGSVADFAGALDRKYHSQIAAWQRSPIAIDDWAWESHEIAEQTAYGLLPHRVAIETPAPGGTCADDSHIAARMLELHEKVDAAYESAVYPVIEQQLAKGGARLAAVLNQIWP
jgi:S1/P1 Nuclease